MTRQLHPFEKTFLVTSLMLLLSWFVWATSITSSKFWLIGGSDALVKVARHPAAYRWLLGGAVLIVLSTTQYLLWRQPSAPGPRRLMSRLLASVSLTFLGIVALGSLNWALFYDPLALSVKSAFGGLVLEKVQLHGGEDGPCAGSSEVRDDEAFIDGSRLRLRWWPVPLEDDGLRQFLTAATCP